MFNTFDFDGVIYLGDFIGVQPTIRDHIVTGRSYEEYDFVEFYLRDVVGLRFPLENIHMNPLPYSQKSRESSAKHKVEVIQRLRRKTGESHGVHFEDDPLQIKVMNELDPSIRIVHLVHNFTRL